MADQNTIQPLQFRGGTMTINHIMADLMGDLECMIVTNSKHEDAVYVPVYHEPGSDGKTEMTRAYKLAALIAVAPLMAEFLDNVQGQATVSIATGLPMDAEQIAHMARMIQRYHLLNDPLGRQQVMGEGK